MLHRPYVATLRQIVQLYKKLLKFKSAVLLSQLTSYEQSVALVQWSHMPSAVADYPCHVIMRISEFTMSEYLYGLLTVINY